MNGRKAKKGIRKKLPPHTWQIHHPHAGEANKPFLVAIITVGLLIVLSIFLLYGSKFVGKAYTVPGGHSLEVVSEGGKIKVMATLQPPAAASGVYLELSPITAGVNICENYQSAVSNKLWKSFEELSCTNNKLKFGDATIDNEEFKSGTFTLIEITPFSALALLESSQLQVDQIDIYDGLTGRDLFPAGDVFTLTRLGCEVGKINTCSVGPGTCGEGTQTCQDDGTWSECAGKVSIEAETCDGLDNDCNGQVDDNVCNDNQHCGSYTIVCPGSQECDSLTRTCTSLIACTSNTQCQNAARACSGGYCRSDSDHDGVADIVDQCAGTILSGTLTINDVNAEGCLSTQMVADTASSLPETASRGGGSGGGCVPSYSCGVWSYCNATLQQSRSCLDQSQCRKPAKMEVQACPICQESWVCSVWSSCLNGAETRTCRDEHSCGTAVGKPDEYRSCSVAPPPSPVKPYTPSPSPAYTSLPARSQQPLPLEPSGFIQLWNQYKSYIVGIPVSAAVLAALLIAGVHISRKRKLRQPAVNVEELRRWVAQERKIGSSDERIKEALKGTEWTESEISQVLGKIAK